MGNPLRITFCCSGTEPEPWLQGLRAALPGAEVSLWQPGAQLADVAVVWGPPQAFFDEQTRLQAIFNTGAGVDALLRLHLPAGVPLVRLEDAGMGAQMAEYVCHAVIGHYREFGAIAADVAQGLWRPRMPAPRAQHTVAVLGLGVLGQRVLRALQAFDFPVRGWSRTPKTLPGVATFAGPDGLRACVQDSAVLVNLLPLTPETRGLLNCDTLAWLRPGAQVVNVARGAHVVDDDLLALLDSGHIGHAALDVFHSEPLPADHPYWRHPRVSLTPHTSARTLRDESIAQIARNIHAWRRGEPLSGVVDRDRAY
jgi:glyoxylate/hydroxypyruvate reductase A